MREREKNLNNSSKKKTQPPPQQKKKKKKKKTLFVSRHRHDRPPLPRPARLLPGPRGGNHPAVRARGDVSGEGGCGGERCCCRRGFSGSGSGGGGGNRRKGCCCCNSPLRLLCRLRGPSPAPRRRRAVAPLPPGRARLRGPAAHRGVVVAQGGHPPRVPRRPAGPEGHGAVVAARRAARPGGR